MSANFDRLQRKNRSLGTRRHTRQHASIAPSLRARQEQGIDQQIWFLHQAMVEVIIAEPWRITGLLARIEQYYAQGQLRHGAYLFWHSALTSAQLAGVIQIKASPIDEAMIVAPQLSTPLFEPEPTDIADNPQGPCAPLAPDLTSHQSVTKNIMSHEGAAMLRSSILALTPQAEKYRRKTMLIGVLTEAQRQAALERARQCAFFPEPAI
jgi:hypothetical protein